MTSNTTPPSESILVVDDELGITAFLEPGLRNAGFRVEVARDGPTGLALARSRHPDLIILDVMLPAISGLEICRLLRGDAATREIPILMISAKDSVVDRVNGLNTGADDYLIKPIAFAELLARVQALLRRQQRARATALSGRVLRFEELSLNEATREVSVRERPVMLTATEFNLLRLLMLHPRQVLEKLTILERVWGYDFNGDTNIVEVYVRYLREKLELDPSDPKLIQTVRGVGYVLRGA